MENIDELIAERSAILSEMFGYTREEADKEAKRRIDVYNQETKRPLDSIKRRKDSE